MRFDKDKKYFDLGGSCFRLSPSNHFITAAHCVRDAKPSEIKIMNVLDDKNDFKCTAIHPHDKADIAILEVEGKIPDIFEPFKIAPLDDKLGLQVHCFGYLAHWEQNKHYAPARVIGGIIQRGINFSDAYCTSDSFEFSSPIPKGMSGSPTFLANKDDIALGMAIATISTEIAVSVVSEYEKNNLKEREKISEFTRFGVILKLLPLKNWLQSFLPLQ